MTPLDQWLSDATRELSAESVVQVRLEIQEHYDSACETGETSNAAIAALGDPRAANRAYRKVLLTEREAAAAPVLTLFKRPGFSRILLYSAVAAAFSKLLSLQRRGPGFWPIVIAMYCIVLLSWFFPATTLARCRIHVGLLGVQSIVLGAIAWWYSGWIPGFTLGAVIFLFSYFLQHHRLAIFRKLEGGQTYRPPAEPQLTQMEAITLVRLRNGEPYENISTAILLLIVAGSAVFLPATFAPMAACIFAIVLAQRTLPIYTEESSRRYRIAKWTAMAVTAALPVLYGARLPWGGAVFLAHLFRLFDMRNMSIRRKLPVTQWPKRLYW